MNADRMQGTPAHVDHLFVLRQVLIAVGRFQCIGQFQIKLNAGSGRTFEQRFDQCHTGLVLQIMFKGDIRHFHFKAQFVVQNVSQFLRAQQCWIQFDGGVQLSLFDKIAADLFDFIWWAAVHGGYGDIVCDPVGNF